MIHIAIGTRAQLIKVIPLMHELTDRNIDYNFINFSQHKDTVEQMLDDLHLKKPDIYIGSTDKEIVSITQLFIWSVKTTIYSILKSNKIFRGDKSGIVIVHGDALPLFFGAIAGKRQRLKVAQIEAGLRSYNFLKPFPEEIVRYVTAKLRLIDIHYCQDDTAMTNAKKYHGEKVFTNGNTIYDSIQLAKKKNIKSSKKINPKGKFALVTIHRTENLNDLKTFQYIIKKIEEISKNIDIYMIMHPVTRQKLLKSDYYSRLDSNEKIHLIPRLSFFDFNKLLIECEFIISDGGSNQEEASYLGIPCLLFRRETERIEGLGENVVLSKFDDKVIEEFVNNYSKYRREIVKEGKAPTQIIVDDILLRTNSN